MEIKVLKDKISCNYLKDLECYEVELIANEKPCDTTLRLEFIDNDYINITISELQALKELLNSPEFEQFVKTCKA